MLLKKSQIIGNIRYYRIEIRPTPSNIMLSGLCNCCPGRSIIHKCQKQKCNNINFKLTWSFYKYRYYPYDKNITFLRKKI